MQAISINRLKTYASFVKLEHTVFSLPLVYAGVWLGGRGLPSVRVLGLVLLTAIGGRVTAMGLNRLIDVEIDRRNPRTKRRELACGAMQVWEGWAVVALFGMLYLASASAIAPICLKLSPIPLLLFAGYPYLKRFTSLAHLGLGLAWSMAPLGGWLAAAASSEVEGLAASQSLARLGEAGWLWLFSVLWVSGFDIIYATMDEAFDRASGLHALPATLGKRKALRVAALVHLSAFMALYALWRTQLHTLLAFGWLLAIGILFIWQHAVAERKPEFAFFQLNGALGFLVFGLVLTGMSG